MTKVVFNKDGSIKNVLLPEYVTQGSTGESDALKVAVTIDGEDVTASGYSAIAYFKLPNGETTPLGFTNNGTFDIAGETYKCKYLYLDTSVTLYEGIVLVSIRLSKDVGSIQTYTYNWRLVVNPTNFDPYENEENITNAQYQNMFDMVSQFINYKKLPYYEVEETDIVYDFIDEHNLFDKPIIVKFYETNYHRTHVLLGVYTKAGSNVAYELYDLNRVGYTYINSGLYNYNETFKGIANRTPTILERQSNRRTTLGSSSDDITYPTTKAVWDLCQTILGIAEGKTESWVVDTTLTISSIKSIEGISDGYFYIWNSTTHEWENKVTELLAGDYDGLTIVNNAFDSTSNEVVAQSGGHNGYIICGTNLVYFLVFSSSNSTDMTVATKQPKKGDVFYILKTNVPDRWFGGGSTYYALESKTDLSGYVTTNTDQEVTGVKQFTNGIEFRPTPGSGSPKWKIETVNGGSYLNFKLGSIQLFSLTSDNAFISQFTSDSSLGKSTYKWAKSYIVKYMDGKNSTYGLVSPDTTSWTADQTIATEDYVDDAIAEAAISVSPYYMHSKVMITKTGNSIQLYPIISSSDVAATDDSTLKTLISKHVVNYDSDDNLYTYEVPCSGTITDINNVVHAVVKIRCVEGLGVDYWYAYDSSGTQYILGSDLGGHTVSDPYINRI